MPTMNVSLPDDLRAFVEEQVAERAYTSTSEYVRDLIRQERDKVRVRAMLLDGANSPMSTVADATYFDGLRSRIRDRA